MPQCFPFRTQRKAPAPAAECPRCGGRLQLTHPFTPTFPCVPWHARRAHAFCSVCLFRAPLIPVPPAAGFAEERAGRSRNRPGEANTH